MSDRPSNRQIGGDHYKNMVDQPIEFCMANRLDACESAVIKYVCRHRSKGGKEDLLKARHYIDLLVEWEYGLESGDGIIDQPTGGTE